MDFPSKALLAVLMKRAIGPEALHDAIAKYSAIRTSLNSQRQQIEAERDRMEKKLAQMEASLKVIQKGCDHPDITRNGDPSGGSDSFTVCNICGAEL